MKRNETLETALAELSAVGIRDVTRSYGGRHLQIHWRANGHGERMYTIPCTPGDVRTPHNVRSDIRKILKEDGFLISEPKPLQPPPKQPDRLTLLIQKVAELEQRVKLLENEKKTDDATAFAFAKEN